MGKINPALVNGQVPNTDQGRAYAQEKLDELSKELVALARGRGVEAAVVVSNPLHFSAGNPPNLGRWSCSLLLSGRSTPLRMKSGSWGWGASMPFCRKPWSNGHVSYSSILLKRIEDPLIPTTRDAQVAGLEAKRRAVKVIRELEEGTWYTSVRDATLFFVPVIKCFRRVGDRVVVVRVVNTNGYMEARQALTDVWNCGMANPGKYPRMRSFLEGVVEEITWVKKLSEFLDWDVVERVTKEVNRAMEVKLASIREPADGPYA